MEQILIITGGSKGIGRGIIEAYLAKGVRVFSIARSVDGEFVRKLNQILNKNRKLLREETASGQSNVKRENLSKKGFDFDYHTHYHLSDAGKVYIFCYEYGYTLAGDDEVILMKKE